MKISRKGYSLIELLVSVGIITVLLGVSLAGISSVRIRSRDSKRIADLQTIQSALEQYSVNDPSHTYPIDDDDADTTAPVCAIAGLPTDDGKGIYGNPCFRDYLSVVPLDPENKAYIYHRPACLTLGTGPTNLTSMIFMDQSSLATNCIAANQKYSLSYGLHIELESDKNREALNDSSGTDPFSYDLMQ